MRSPLTSSIRDRPAVPVVLVLVTLGFTLIINLYGLLRGISIVIPHLFYIPIILAAFFFRRWGIAFAAGISAVYLLMVWLVHPGYSPDLLSAAARCLVFIIIAAVVSALSERISLRETELLRAKDDWERTFDAVPDLVALIDRNHRILRVNRAMAESLGISKERAVGMRCFDVVHHASHPPLHCPHAMLLSDGREHTGEIHEDRLGGDFLVTASPLRDAEGTVIGSVHSARDITQRRQVERALKQSEESLQQKSQVLALRNRELNCLYEVARLVETTDSTESLLTAVAGLLPSAWPYPDSTCARVVLNNREFSSAAFRECNRVQDAPIVVRGKNVGRIEIFFTGDNKDILPFPSGETDLLLTIAERLGRVLERKETEKALQESEEKILLLLNSAAEGIYGIDLDGNCTFCNNACLSLLGYHHQDDLLTKNMHWQIHAKHADGSPFPVEECRIFQAFRKGVGTHVDDEVLWRADGSSFPAEYWSYPQYRNGQIVGAVVTFLDITDRKRAESALRESEGKYRTIIDEMQDIFYRTDLAGKITMLSPSAARLAGYDSLDQLLGRDVTSVYADPADRDRLLAALRETGSVYAFPMDLKVRDGSIRHVTTSSHFYRDPHGNIAGVEGVIHNITDLRRAEDALRESEERYRTIIENITDVFFRIDRESRIVMVSPSAPWTFGYASTDEMLGMPVVRLWKYPDHRHRFIDALESQGGVVRDWEAEFVKKDGSAFWVSISANMRRDGHGGYAGTEGFIRDISERKKMEESLKIALRKLNMLSSITRHDILNQITGLRTFLELSREDLMGTPHEEFIRKEDQAAEAIQRQIEFTKYYQDIGVNAPKWQDVRSVIREALDQLNLKGIDVEIDVPAVEIFADPLIVKVFFNLMENSLRHGERVTKVGFFGSRSARGFTLTYRDNGIGVSAEDKKKLFRKGFGKHTGLGLYLSQEILAITGIIIMENGTPGEGVQFEITVPEGGFRFSDSSS